MTESGSGLEREGASPPKDQETKERTERVVEPTTEAQLRERRRAAATAMEMIVDDLQEVDPENAGLWNVKKQDWGMALHRALQEPRGSVETEHQDLVEPMSLLAMRAFRRIYPNAYDMPEGIVAESERTRGLARQTWNTLGERYPSHVSQPAVHGKRFGELLGTLGERMRTQELAGSYGARLQALAEMEDLSALQRLEEVDTILEGLADILAEVTLEDAVQLNTSDAFEHAQRVQEGHRQQVAALLPVMKSLLDVRAAMSRDTFGHEKSPDDVTKLARTGQ